MSVLFVLVPIALVTVAAAIVAFVWAARQGQFDDLVTPAWRAVHDDERAARDENRSTEAPRGAARRSER